MQVLVVLRADDGSVAFELHLEPELVVPPLVVRDQGRDVGPAAVAALVQVGRAPGRRVADQDAVTVQRDRRAE